VKSIDNNKNFVIIDTMKIIACKFIFLITVAKLFSQAPLEEKYQVLIRPFVEAIRNNDREKITNLIHYPLRRQYPMPHIYNGQEMIERYDQVFDEILINIIMNSSIENDWHDVGWRGIMLNNGLIWIDFDGKLYSINYHSPQEYEMI
jgi:hypothetical protein